jgi:hypothetical protein
MRIAALELRCNGLGSIRVFGGYLIDFELFVIEHNHCVIFGELQAAPIANRL